MITHLLGKTSDVASRCIPTRETGAFDSASVRIDILGYLKLVSVLSKEISHTAGKQRDGKNGPFEFEEASLRSPSNKCRSDM